MFLCDEIVFFVLQLRSIDRKTKPSLKKNSLCTEVKILKCNECNKTFASQTGFNQHNQYHTGQFSFSCDICNGEFNSSSNCNVHMRGHEGRGYSCDFCDRVFKSAQARRYHESDHTGQNGLNMKSQ